jgi:hypothetical protein
MRVGSKFIVKDELYVDFSELTMMIIKKVFTMASAGDDEGLPDPTKANIDKKAKMK